MAEARRHVHFVGVGGSGMSPLAEVLLRRGVRVSGSDMKASTVTGHLETIGLAFHEGHDAAHLGDADLVVRSSAVRPSNPEVAEAGRRGVPVITRGALLAELMRERRGLAVAGAHGKTTTTSMIGLVLDRAGLDPTVVIGGRLAAFGSSARVGAGDLLVAEADESDRSFLLLTPAIVVVTNIDREHLDSYRDLADLERAFETFVSRVPEDGVAILCADDPALRRIADRAGVRVVRYGLDDPSAELTATGVTLEGFGSSCVVARRRPAGLERLGILRLAVPGRHNVANALAAIAAGQACGVPFEVIAGALAGFGGAERRFEWRGEARGVTVVDDYGHHPTEILAVLAAARASGAARVVCVFQPHRYSRTSQLLADFGPALAMADVVVLTDIYAAGEEPIPGVSAEALADEVRRAGQPHVRVVPALADVPAEVARLARPGDLVLTLGAGSIGGVGAQVVEALAGCP